MVIGHSQNRMGEGRQMIISSLAASVQNPLVQLQEKVKDIDTQFKAWLSKQSIAVEAAVVTAKGAVQGAAIGGLMSALNPGDISSVLPSLKAGNPEVVASLKNAQALSGDAFVQARNFAVMTGVNAGLASVMKRVREVDDVQGSMVAAFGSGTMFSLVSGMGGSPGPNQMVNAISSGILFALVQGALFQFGKKMSSQAVEDKDYCQTKNMLKDLGFESYAKKFKKGMLNDQTLPLLTDSALKDISIPPGPRLIILDHIQRDTRLVKGRQ